MYLVCFLVLAATLSIAWSTDALLSTGYVLVLIVNLVPVAYVASAPIGEAKKLVCIIGFGWFAALLFTLPVAYFEIATGQHFSFSLESRGGGPLAEMLPYASVFFGNFNDYSLYITLCISILLISLFNPQLSEQWKKKGITLIILSLIPLVPNASRGSLIVTVILLLYTVLSNFRIRHFISSMLLVFLALAVVWASSVQAENPLIQYLSLKFTDFSNDISAESGRIAILQASTIALSNSHWVGFGAGAYASYLEQHFPNIIPNPHNLFVEVALNFGLAGLFLFIAYTSLLVLKSIQIRAHFRQEATLIMLCLLLLPVLGVVQSHLTGYTYFWLWLASIVLILQSKASTRIPSDVSWEVD